MPKFFDKEHRTDYKLSDLPLPREPYLPKDRNRKGPDPAKFGPLDGPLKVYLNSEKRDLPQCSEELKSLVAESTTHPVNFNHPLTFWVQLHKTCVNHLDQFARETSFHSLQGFYDLKMQTFVRLSNELHSFKSRYEDCLIYNFAILCIENDQFWRDRIEIPFGDDPIMLPDELLKPLHHALTVIHEKVNTLYDNKALATAKMSQFDQRAEGLINITKQTMEHRGIHTPEPVLGVKN